ncbi:MAG: DNA repair protein RadA [Acidobacteriota bacterium]|nr:DNA repair protein RadA [Acidobacteriota bacterium]MDH3786514.1 DNA repair protein RadA [Acidobacteriota bacterium]
MPRRPGFVCESCSYRTAKWLGRCPECDSWDTIRESMDSTSPDSTVDNVVTQAFTEIDTPVEDRIPTGLDEFDRVLGGGLVRGSAVLVGGEPGIGKSTLLLQAAAALSRRGLPVLYASGEESISQIRLRGQRLGVSSADLHVMCESRVEAIEVAIGQVHPTVVIADSIQTLRSAESSGIPGSVQQVRHSAGRLVDNAKERGHVLVLVGHVTKDGAIAGPRTLEHLVDCVLQFEGDRRREHRLLRGLKNRFGPTDELGVYRMAASGLAEVSNPSERFLSERTTGTAGSVVMAAVEGQRALLVEVQALVGEARPGLPRRTALGVDAGRLAMILAVLERSARISLSDRDVFVNVTGGLSLKDPASDLAVAAALVSSVSDRPLPDDAVLFGEIGLTGELRDVPQVELRLKEAARMGFRQAILPAVSTGGSPPSDIHCVHCERIGDALKTLRPAVVDQIG